MNQTKPEIEKVKKGYKISLEISGRIITKFCLKNRLSFETGRAKRLRKLVNDCPYSDERTRLVKEYIHN